MEAGTRFGVPWFVGELFGPVVGNAHPPMAAPAPTVAVPFITFNDASKQYEVSAAAAAFLEGLPDSIGKVGTVFWAAGGAKAGGAGTAAAPAPAGYEV